MDLNLPILHLLQDKDNIMIAGAGGGFDVYAGLPLFFTLKAMGKTVHLANYSFVDFRVVNVIMEEVITEIESLLIGVQGKMERDFPYFPEAHLSDWLTKHDMRQTVWMIASSGVQTIKAAYEHLTKKLDIDALILVDGGVDSLMRGDEEGPGTLMEDTITLMAIKDLDIPVKIMTSIGFGTEVEEGVSHHSALENMANLIKMGGFYGSCALTKEMPVFHQYEAACRYAWEGADNRHKSHISTRIIPAVHGEFDDFRMYQGRTKVFISPLMSLYWFFDANTVAEASILGKLIENSYTVQDAMQAYMDWVGKNRFKMRQAQIIPY